MQPRCVITGPTDVSLNTVGNIIADSTMSLFILQPESSLIIVYARIQSMHEYTLNACVPIIFVHVHVHIAQ